MAYRGPFGILNSSDKKQKMGLEVGPIIFDA